MRDEYCLFDMHALAIAVFDKLLVQTGGDASVKLAMLQYLPDLDGSLTKITALVVSLREHCQQNLRHLIQLMAIQAYLQTRLIDPLNSGSISTQQRTINCEKTTAV